LQRHGGADVEFDARGLRFREAPHRFDGGEQRERVVRVGKPVGEGAREAGDAVTLEVDGAPTHAGGHAADRFEERAGGAHEDRGEGRTVGSLHPENLDVEAGKAIGSGGHAVPDVADADFVEGKVLRDAPREEHAREEA